MNPALIDSVLAVHRAATAAGHGGKEAIYAEACQRLGMTRSTLMRKIKEAAVKPPRKQRDDAGDVSLKREEAVKISAVLMESLRKNNKRLLSIGQAVSMLRANGEIRAERIAPATGECIPLSDSAIARALRAYGLHPDQLLRAAAWKHAGVTPPKPRSRCWSGNWAGSKPWQLTNWTTCYRPEASCSRPTEALHESNGRDPWGRILLTCR